MALGICAGPRTDRRTYAAILNATRLIKSVQYHLRRAALGIGRSSHDLDDSGGRFDTIERYGVHGQV